MNKLKVKGWIDLALAVLILFHTGSLYRAGGFSSRFGSRERILPQRLSFGATGFVLTAIGSFSERVAASCLY